VWEKVSPHELAFGVERGTRTPNTKWYVICSSISNLDFLNHKKEKRKRKRKKKHGYGLEELHVQLKRTRAAPSYVYPF
jgi:hypothetical protein